MVSVFPDMPSSQYPLVVSEKMLGFYFPFSQFPTMFLHFS